MRKLFKACFLGLLFPILLNGQEIGLLRLAPDRQARQGGAAVWGGVEDGGYKPTYAAKFQWSAGADADITRHGETSSWTGALSFKQTVGHHMSSSMLLEPAYYPFDILEFETGAKSRQDVRLDFGYLKDFGYEWAAGFKAAAQGANVTKRQDVRHSSLGIDVQFEPVLTYVMDDDMGLASSYRVRYRTETLKAAEDAGDLFLDEGMRYGTYQALEGNGAFPIQELSHGFSELFYSPEVSAGLELIWKRGQAGGKSGERFQFPGSTISAFFQHSILAEKVDHVYGASYSRMRDQLRQKTDGGIQAPSDRNHRNLALQYEARFVDGVLKKAGITLDGNFWTERSFVGGSDQDQRFDGTAKAHIALSYGLFDLDASVQAGNGWWKDPGKNGQVSESRPAPLTDDWLRNMDYFLTKRVGLGGTLTGHVGPSLYLQLYVYWYHALDVTLLPGDDREVATLKVGYKF